MNENTSRITYLLLAFIILASLPIKFMTAQNMPYDIDIVPVLARNVEYTIPPVGTLSSVAAYNFPMLEWLHLPVQALTGNVWWTIFLTLIIFNTLGTFATFCLADSMFDERAGLAAATLFTFSEVGISSTYTAWAQLLLPSFFVMTLFFLWEWHRQEKGIYLAGAGIIATAAFMTHFSALLLYPAMLVFALITRAKWQWRGLLIGAIIALLMFLPYMLFELDRDFVDLKAFVTQDVLIEPEILAEYEIYKSDYRPLQSENITVNVISAHPEPPSRWRRALNYAFSTPRLYIEGFNYAFNLSYRGFDTALPVWIASSLKIFGYFPMLFFWLSLLIAGFQFLFSVFPKWSKNAALKSLSVYGEGFREGSYKRIFLLWFFLSVILVLMILTRTINNASYLMGFSSLQLVIASTIFYLLPKKKWALLATVILLTTYASVQTSERFLRLKQHDDSVFSAYNVSIYRHIEAVTDFIAEDWEGGDSLTVSYDILPEMPSLWWTAAWHHIDPSYRMGMNFDFLLIFHHGLTNLNTDPIGTVENADYIIIYLPALERYRLEDYDIHTFGAILVLK